LSSVDQNRVLRLLADQRELFARQGGVHPSWRYYRGRRLGPFYRLLYRQDGKQRAVYLGADLALAEEVRAALGELQSPLRERRERRRLLEGARRALRAQMTELDRELKKVGLYRKGNEVRGAGPLPTPRGQK
jgi:hypothetical protein